MSSLKSSKGNILVIENERLMRALVERLLKRRGFEVMSAASGASGIKAFVSWWPDLVICDMHLPDMSTSEILSALGRLHSEAVIILISGYASEYEVEEGFRLGAAGYLVKSFDNDDFVRNVESFIKRCSS